MRRYKIVLLLVLIGILLGTAAYAYAKRQEIERYFFERRGKIPGVKVEPLPVPDAQRWQILRKDLERWRIFYAEKYRKAGSTTARQAVIMDARNLLEHNLPELMRCWLGTGWDFNGTAKEPGAGKIACGYFVATVMEGAGFHIKRSPLAQQASQNILRTFLPQSDLHLRVGVPYKTYRAEISRGKPGIYIVGLDTHVGFIVVPNENGKDYRFIHSSGAKPWCVVEENADQAKVLQNSNYRVIGNLTASDALITKWLKGEDFPTFR